MRTAAFAFVIVLAVVVGAAAFLLLTRGDDEPELGYSPFWDSEGPYPYTYLYENWSPVPPRSPTKLYRDADAVIVGRVETAVRNDGSSMPTFKLTPEEYEVVARDRSPANVVGGTLYRVEPIDWLKGEGSDSVIVFDNGGRDPRRRYSGIMEGNFVLEPGRTYLLFLRTTEHWVGDYSRMERARGTFDLTTDRIKVFNSFTTEDLEQYDGLMLDQFLAEAVGLPKEAVAVE